MKEGKIVNEKVYLIAGWDDDDEPDGIIISVCSKKEDAERVSNLWKRNFDNTLVKGIIVDSHLANTLSNKEEV